MGKIAFDRRWVFCFWTLMFGCQRNMVIHVNNGWKLGLKSSTVANDGEQWWTTDKLWFDTFWYVFDTTVPAVVACLAAHSVGYKPSFRWSGQVLFSQHRVATQRVGGKDGRRLGVPKTEPKKDVLTDQGRTGYYTPAWTSRQEAMDKILLTVDYYEFYWTKPAPIWCTSAWEQLFHGSVQTGMLLPVRFKILPSDYLTKVWQLWKVTTFTSYYFFGG